MRALAYLTIPALCAGVLLVAACGSKVTETSSPTDETTAGVVARLDEQRYLGASFDIDNLRVWPVHTTQPLDVGEFLTLQEAQEAGLATVREIGGGVAGSQQRNMRAGRQNLRAGQNDVQIEVQQEDEQANAEPAPTGPMQNGAIGQAPQTTQIIDVQLDGGGGAQVGTLAIVNNGDLPLLVCAGTIVKGGNQDRQIGQDIVVAAGETVPVDAFCVEAGRWTNVREGIANGGEFVAMKVLASKNVRAKGQYENDQSGVWQEVAVARAQSLSPASGGAGGGSGAAESGTTFVDALEKVDDATKQKRERAVATILARFDELSAGDDPPVGFAYAVNGDPQVVRVFAHNRLLRRNLESFANTMAVEAEGAPDAEFEPCNADAVVALVRAIEKDAEQKREQTQARNVNVLLSNGVGFNGNCYVEDEAGEEVPLTQDWTKK